MPITEIGGIKIHYQRIYCEPEVVMIHGLMSNLAFWYLGALPLLGRDLGITAYDLRGHGLSEKPGFGYSSEDMAHDLIGLLDYLKIECANLVGHSFGGAVALHAAVLFPERVRSLVLADARVPSLQPPLTTPTARQWEMLRRRLHRLSIELPANSPRVAYPLYQELANTQALQRRSGAAATRQGQTDLLVRLRDGGSIIQQWTRLIQSTTAGRDLQTVRSLTPKRIAKVEQPTLAIFGEYTNCLPTLRRLQANLKNCRTIIVPKVGHLHPITSPGVFVRHLQKFINEVSG